MLIRAKRTKINRISKSKASTGYRFIDKDPAIDLVMGLVHDSGISFTEIEARCGVSKSTLYAWDKGKTRRPQHLTLTFVLRAIGYEYKLVRTK